MLTDPEFERLTLGSETRPKPQRASSRAAHRALSDRRKWCVGNTVAQPSVAEILLKYQ